MASTSKSYNKNNNSPIKDVYSVVNKLVDETSASCPKYKYSVAELHALKTNKLAKLWPGVLDRKFSVTVHTQGKTNFEQWKPSHWYSDFIKNKSRARKTPPPPEKVEKVTKPIKDLSQLPNAKNCEDLEKELRSKKKFIDLNADEIRRIKGFISQNLTYAERYELEQALKHNNNENHKCNLPMKIINNIASYLGIESYRLTPRVIHMAIYEINDPAQKKVEEKPTISHPVPEPRPHYAFENNLLKVLKSPKAKELGVDENEKKVFAEKLSGLNDVSNTYKAYIPAEQNVQVSNLSTRCPMKLKKAMENKESEVITSNDLDIPSKSSGSGPSWNKPFISRTPALNREFHKIDHGEGVNVNAAPFKSRSGSDLNRNISPRSDDDSFETRERVVEHNVQKPPPPITGCQNMNMHQLASLLALDTQQKQIAANHLAHLQRASALNPGINTNAGLPSFGLPTNLNIPVPQPNVSQVDQANSLFLQFATLQSMNTVINQCQQMAVHYSGLGQLLASQLNAACKVPTFRDVGVGNETTEGMKTSSVKVDASFDKQSV